MTDSDSDSGGEWDKEKCQKYSARDSVATFRISEEVFKNWLKIPSTTKREATQRMKVCSFWLPILLQGDDSITASWGIEIGLISSKSTEDLKLKHLRKIEVVETILLFLEKGTMKKESTRHVLSLSNMFNLRSTEVYENALRWLEMAGDCNVRMRLKELGSPHTCFTALHFIFTQFAKFIQELGGNLEQTLKTLLARPNGLIVERCEEMKKRGNENFQKHNYEDALEFYSKAITLYPDNHILYGNRALCYIRCQKYLKAVCDGKRAILIEPRWAKGHYRFCEALFYLGEYQLALQANSSAKQLCKGDPDGLRDLNQQCCKFTAEFQQRKGPQPKKTPGFKGGVMAKQSQTPKTASKAGLATNKAAKVTEVKMDRKTVKTEKAAESESNIKDSKVSQSAATESNVSAKKEPSRSAKDKNPDMSSRGKDACKELKSLVEDGHTALYDLRSRNAEQAFSKALTLVETITPEELGLSTLDVLLLLFGHALALTEIGQIEELGQAEKLLEKIKEYEVWVFQSLVFYATGRVYLRENRFAVALQQFLDSLQMVKNQITPGKLTWPLTKEVVRETEPEQFKEILESAIDLCKYPPAPDAICRLDKCLFPLKAEIYFTDPDFKGFIRLCCCQKCSIEFHITCWKTVKTSVFSEKNEKDILHDACLTPDCMGQIVCIKIFGPTGLVKCKFEATIVKPQKSKKPKVNQKCTSPKKLKSKEDRKLKRKHLRRSFQDNQPNGNEILQQEELSETQSLQKAWVLYRDRILLQISQNKGLLENEKNFQISGLIHCLKPWLELDFFRGNQIAFSLLNYEEGTLAQAVELLLERKHRVWARIFIQHLSNCVDINPKLSGWACRLNEAGLNASRTFIERYSGQLEQLDLSPLLKFEPLQNMIIEKLGAQLELFSSIDLSVTDYLKQAPPDVARLFIWTLEEFREDYDPLHAILDEYFDMMDGHCSVFKKSDENNSPVRAKNRGRKKKKEPKGLKVFPAMNGVEPDQVFFDDDSLSFLHPADSFSVPSHLREQVAEFEEQYNSTNHAGRCKWALDNNPDPAQESMFDYFAQILEEHGPLMADDPLLVGELEHFPAVARQKIEEAGSFEAFLLESLRFVKVGRCVGLAKHSVSLQEAGQAASLDDLDDIADSDLNFSNFDLDDITGNGFHLDNYTLQNPYLQNPYAFPPQSSGSDFLPHWREGDFEMLPHFQPNGYEELDLDTFDYSAFETKSAPAGVPPVETESSLEKVPQKHAAVQTLQEPTRSVAVNTELHERFETSPGDINKTEKHNAQLQQQILDLTNNLKAKPINQEDIILCEQEIKKITTNIQVTHKELAMFQQKLEEDLKKDQKEKKANQETLKALKVEKEQLLEEQVRFTKRVEENKKTYDTKLREFLDLSNQSAAKKTSLEDEIKRYQTLLTSATRRSHTAQLFLLESSRDQKLNGLHRELADNKTLLSKLDEVIHRFPNKGLEVIREDCKVNIIEVEKKISAAEKLFRELMDQQKSRRAEKLQNNISNQSEAAGPSANLLSAAAREFVPQVSAPPSRSTPASTQNSTAASEAAAPLSKKKLPNRKCDPPHTTVFEKAMDSLTSMFPDYSRLDLVRFIQELRTTRGGMLSNMSLQDMVSGVTQLILDHQEKLSAAKANAVGRGSPAHTPPLLAYSTAWQPVSSQRPPGSKALNVEDPCIICHEDMNPDETAVLECRHSFHTECIKSWLKEQRTCPTCRTHALLTDDFPKLPGRRHLTS
uniref:RING-type E3 ubiquitin transferase n=1 Tax=Oryzias latipes TaxID=8090 RepID=A0A3P9JLH2_ORYLA